MTFIDWMLAALAVWFTWVILIPAIVIVACGIVLIFAKIWGYFYERYSNGHGDDRKNKGTNKET